MYSIRYWALIGRWRRKRPLQFWTAGRPGYGNSSIRLLTRPPRLVVGAQYGVPVDPFQYYRHLRVTRSFVEYHITEPIALADVAREVNLSSAYFSRVFREKSGMRFSDWLCAMRVAHAKQLMEADDKPMTKIAFEAGFGSLSAFERNFKKLEGLTPRQFQKIVQHSPQKKVLKTSKNMLITPRA